MVKTQAKIVLGFVVVLVSIELIYSLVTGQGNWRAFLAVNLVITPVFAVISYIKVRDFRAYVEGRRRVAIEQWNAVIDEAVEALVDDMARLSPGDLSIFVSIAQLPDD